MTYGRSQKNPLGYVFHSTHYENLDKLLETKQLRSLPSLIHDLKLVEGKDFQAKSGGASRNLSRILENPSSRAYGGIFFSQNGIGEEAPQAYYNRFVPVSFGFNLHELLKRNRSNAVGINESKDVIIFSKRPKEKTKVPISQAEVMFFPSAVYFDTWGNLFRPPHAKPYLEEYARVSVKELDRLSEKHDEYLKIAQDLKARGLYPEVSDRLKQLFLSTLDHKKLELSKARNAEEREKLQRKVGLLEKCGPAMQADGVSGILTMTEGQLGMVIDRLIHTHRLKFGLFKWERTHAGRSLEELFSFPPFDPADTFYRIWKEKEEPPKDYRKLVAECADQARAEISSETKQAIIKRKKTALTNDAALALVLVSPTKLFLSERRQSLIPGEGERIEKFKHEFMDRLKSKLEPSNPFFKTLLRENGRAIFLHPHVSDYLAKYCQAREEWETYQNNARRKNLMNSREFLLWKLKQKGIRTRPANKAGDIVDVIDHRKAGLPPKIVFFGDRGREDLPLHVENFLKEKNVRIPERRHTTYLEEKEREEQGKRTIAHLKAFMARKPKLHATFEKIDAYAPRRVFGRNYRLRSSKR